MFERALNAFWILLGAATAIYAWKLGLVGPSGPESGLFPMIAAVIIMVAGIVQFVRPSSYTQNPEFPVDAGLWRILGVVAGLAVMAIGLPYLGFAITGAITMMILLRTVEQTSWLGSVVLALGSVAVVVLVFGNLLGMVLPRGPWGF